MKFLWHIRLFNLVHLYLSTKTLREKNGSKKVANSFKKRIIRDGIKLNYCCICGRFENELDRGLELHHLLSRAQYPQYKDTVDNVITVCRECHNHIHDHKTVLGRILEDYGRCRMQLRPQFIVN